MALVGDDLRRQIFYHGVQTPVILAAFFFRKLFHKALENDGTGIRYGINRVSHTVDQPLVIKGFSVQELPQVVFYFFSVLRIPYVLFQIIKHPHDLDIGTAVLRTLE